MPYLPTTCDTCGRVRLMPTGDRVELHFSCVFCFGTARVIPGCSYADEDLPLFTELGQLVQEASISPVDAQRVVNDIERACAAGREHEAFATLGAWLPSLAPIHLAVEVDPARRRRALLMLGTILSGVAATRRSGVMAAVSVPEALGRARRG